MLGSRLSGSAETGAVSVTSHTPDYPAAHVGANIKSSLPFIAVMRTSVADKIFDHLHEVSRRIEALRRENEQLRKARPSERKRT